MTQCLGFQGGWRRQDGDVTSGATWEIREMEEPRPFQRGPGHAGGVGKSNEFRLDSEPRCLWDSLMENLTAETCEKSRLRDSEATHTV